MTNVAGKLLGFALGVCVLAGTARAHLPHDVAYDVVVSPDFANDQTAIIVAQLTDTAMLGRSTDGGRSWTMYGSPILAAGLSRLTMSPDFANDQTVFAATGSAGLWRSTDGGVTWSQANAGLSNLQTFDVSCSPDHAVDGRVLAATAEGVFLSEDRGDSWALASVGLGETSILRVAFAPDDPDVAFAGTDLLHRTDDGGLSWQVKQALDHPLESLSVSPAYSTDTTLAVAFGRFGGGVHVSHDGGDVLAPANSGLVDLAVNRVVIAADGTTYAVAKSGGCHRAAAPGAPWTSFTEGFEDPTSQSSNHYLSVAPSPGIARDGTLFVAAYEGLFRSTDGGAVWAQRDIYGVGVARRLSLTPTYPDDGLLFAAEYGGGPWAWRAPVPWASGGGSTPGAGPFAAGPAPSAAHSRTPPVLTEPFPSPWSSLAADVDDLWAGEVTVSPGFASDRTVFYGFQGLWRSTDAGASWTELPSPAPFIRSLELSPDFPSDPTLFLGSSQVGNFLSVDAGANWTPLAGGFPADTIVTTADFSPSWVSDGVLFVGSRNAGLWRTQDGGNTWFDVTPGMPDTRIRVVALSPAFGRDGLVFVGTLAEGLFRSDDGGDSWAPANDGLSSGALATIEDVALSPAFATDGLVFVASGTDGLHRSTDGGVTWQATQEGLTLGMPRSLAVSSDFASDGTVFVGTHSWVWVSRDAGDHWSRLPGYARVDESHPTVIASEGWSEEVRAGSHGGSVAVAGGPGASAEFEFHGQLLRWHAARDTDGGIADVFIDDVPTASVDLYAPTASASEPVFTTSFPAVGWHTVRIVVTGTAQPAAIGTLVRSDGFETTD